MCVPQPTKDCCKRSGLWGCLSFSQWEMRFSATALLSTCLTFTAYPALTGAMLVLNQDFSVNRTAAVQVLLSLTIPLSTCIFPLSFELHEGRQSSPPCCTVLSKNHTGIMLQSHSLLHIQSCSLLPSKHALPGKVKDCKTFCSRHIL